MHFDYMNIICLLIYIIYFIYKNLIFKRQVETEPQNIRQKIYWVLRKNINQLIYN